MAKQELAGKTYGLDNLADLDGQAFITSEAESNRLLGRGADRVNIVLNQQPDKWNIVLTSQASVQPTASTVSLSVLCRACFSAGQITTSQPLQ